ncbi:glycoside hydrolase domain-containing protein [Puia sp. P3]|uniref:glycoside hydrolase domain-containing protein n=1 Tax=Puia sp. P3 TaxID=3423952 RepID=UPI003D673490
MSLLGRRLTLAPSGLPAQIQTFFTPEMTGIGATPSDLLSAPLSFDIAGVSALQYDPVVFTKKEAGTVEWTTTATGDGVRCTDLGPSGVRRLPPVPDKTGR